ncbi:MAG: hypothetical protein U0791_24355 [Gemmataceae bacterium]
MNRLEHGHGHGDAIRAARDALEARQRLMRFRIEQARTKREGDRQAKERQQAAGKQHGRGKVVESLPQPISADSGKARDAVGKLFGVSGKSVDYATKALTVESSPRRSRRASYAPDRPRFLHCGRNVQCRPRGLCWPCHTDPDIRERYPPVSKYGRRGLGNGFIRHRLPDMPTTAPPGTVEKLAVLEQRAERNEALWHPADARWPGDPRPLEWMREAA